MDPMTYLVFCEYIDKVLFFKVRYFALVIGVVVFLGDRVIYDILLLDEFVGHLFVLRRLVLQVAFFVYVINQVVLPLLDAIL